MVNEPARIAAPRRSRVLLVDDHADTADLLRLLLTRRGFEVTTARSVAAAVAAIEAAPVDVPVSDIDLPDGSEYLGKPVGIDQLVGSPAER